LIKRTAIVFDMDGLMVDTEPLSRQAWDEFLRPYGHSLDDKIISRMVGFRADESTRILLEAFDVPLSVEEIIRRKAAIYDEIRTRGVPVMPGFPELQAAIAERGLPWAVATSSPRRHAEEILGQLGLVGACHAIAGGDEVARGKPAPDIYRLAASRLGIPPDQCLALEDSGPGSQAAAAAGMLTVVIPGADMSAVNFSHADYVFGSLHEVAANLDELLAH
jgi:HAD superfamily hydrolase (TIGR01509 family)